MHGADGNFFGQSVQGCSQVTQGNNTRGNPREDCILCKYLEQLYVFVFRYLFSKYIKKN